MLTFGSALTLMPPRSRMIFITARPKVTAKAALAKHKTVSHMSSKNTVAESRNIPSKSAKRCCGLRCTAYIPEAYSVAEPDSEGNEAGEPKDHRQALDTSDDAGMVCFGFGEAHRHHDQVGEGDQCKDRAEEQEGDLRGRAGVPVSAPPVGDCVDLSVLGFDRGRCWVQLSLPNPVSPRTRSVRIAWTARSERTKVRLSKKAMLN